ncbi:MAG: phosphoribosylglycinamide formyltransferase [Bacteroidaceae bacterium]|nr:phosphoribosylglycinamide formyltransferase [Bacteroidaceae bacterium]
MIHLCIFVSGGGTNCENIIRYFANSERVHVDLVVSNRADAYALTRAQRLGVRTVVVTRADFASPERMATLLEGIDYLILAGFLWMIPDFLVAAFPKKILNIHPALLPKYGGKGMYGHHVHEAVKAAGEPLSGITIHYVSEVCDGGEIIFQASTPLSPSDTPDDIADKIHVLEQAHFPRVIEQVVTQ